MQAKDRKATVSSRRRAAEATLVPFAAKDSKGEHQMKDKEVALHALRDAVATATVAGLGMEMPELMKAGKVVQEEQRE